jgi:hypothetical protein
MGQYRPDERYRGRSNQQQRPSRQSELWLALRANMTIST